MHKGSSHSRTVVTNLLQSVRMLSSVLLYTHVAVGVSTLCLVATIGWRLICAAPPADWCARMSAWLLGIATLAIASGTGFVVVSPVHSGAETCAGVALYVAFVAAGLVMLNNHVRVRTFVWEMRSFYGSVGVFIVATLFGY